MSTTPSEAHAVRTPISMDVVSPIGRMHQGPEAAAGSTEAAHGQKGPVVATRKGPVVATRKGPVVATGPFLVHQYASIPR